MQCGTFVPRRDKLIQNASIDVEAGSELPLTDAGLGGGHSFMGEQILAKHE